MKHSTPAWDKPFVTVQRLGSQKILGSVDANARKLKLYPGHTLAYARALYPKLESVDADPKADHHALSLIGLEFLKRYSPLVALSEISTLCLDITGCAHLFGGEDLLLEDMLARFKQKKIRAQIALAQTPGSSYALARWGGKEKMIVPRGADVSALETLPISALRLSEATAQGLIQLGFVQIQQLLQAARGPLVRRFGKELMMRLDQALGQAFEPLTFLSAPDIPKGICTFTEPALNPDYIEKALERLANTLCHELETKGIGARRLDLVFHRVDNSLYGIRVGTVSASHDAKHFMRLFKEHLTKVDYGFGIESLTLSSPLTEPFSSKQYIHALGERAPEDLSGLVDILHNRLGLSHVYQIQARESDVPERSVKRIAALSQKVCGAWPSSLPRPTRLLNNPEKVEAMALLPDHAPLQFIWRETRYRIKKSDGPERIFGEWWKSDDEALAVRDYFQVEDEKGARFWLFRRGDGVDARTGSHEWFLHGFFG